MVLFYTFALLNGISLAGCTLTSTQCFSRIFLFKSDDDFFIFTKIAACNCFSRQPVFNFYFLTFRKAKNVFFIQELLFPSLDFTQFCFPIAQCISTLDSKNKWRKFHDLYYHKWKRNNYKVFYISISFSWNSYMK